MKIFVSEMVTFNLCPTYSKSDLTILTTIQYTWRYQANKNYFIHTKQIHMYIHTYIVIQLNGKLLILHDILCFLLKPPHSLTITIVSAS